MNFRPPEWSTEGRLNEDDCALPDGLDDMPGAWLLVSITRCTHPSATFFLPAVIGPRSVYRGPTRVGDAFVGYLGTATKFTVLQ